jgi:hypothetical protein
MSPGFPSERHCSNELGSTVDFASMNCPVCTVAGNDTTFAPELRFLSGWARWRANDESPTTKSEDIGYQYGTPSFESM